MSAASNGGRTLRFRFYWWLSQHVYPHELWLWKRSADYRRWWGPR